MATSSASRSKPQEPVGSAELLSSAVRAVARLARTVDVVATSYQLSVSQFRILDRLAAGSTGGKSLADWLAVKPPSITALVDGLVKRGFVERGEDIADRRLVTHTLTAEGRNAWELVSTSIANRLGEIVGRLDDAGRSRAMIESLASWNECFDLFNIADQAIQVPQRSTR
jgi:DNA-binding MarR family transcriptional regulator